MISELFANIFGFIVLTGIIIYMIFLNRYIKQSRKDNVEQIESQKKFRRFYNAADMFSIVPVFLVIIMAVNGFFFSFASVNGRSMQPTFCDNDAVIIKYVDLDGFERNDIAIIVQQNLYLIKRIVGLPGDTLTVDATGVYINNVLIEDNSYVSGVHITYDNIVIPDGYFYVLGDNRDNSEDSRLFGLKSEEKLIGKVIYKISTTTCPIT